MNLHAALKNWKSTTSGVLSFVIATGAVVTAIPNSLISQKASGIATVIVGLAKAWVGLITVDAGHTEAVLPGSSTPVLVPSHETPDDPVAVPVKETVA